MTYLHLTHLQAWVGGFKERHHIMIAPLFLLTLGLSFLQAPQEKLIVGLWKHHKDDVFFAFHKDGSMSFKIPVAQGAYGITGKYKFIDGSLLQIELDYQY
jgi:hypothetical protein